jgi:predicted TIM-barrel fold metal-dependent hydrolase
MLSDRRIDCDVHVAPAMEDLLPHLSEYWRDTLVQLQFRQPIGVNWTYPLAFPKLTATPENTSPAAMEDAVLSRSSVAILNSYFGIETMQHPFQAEAVASAVNRWLQTEWLDRDPRLLASAVVTPQYASGAVAEIERIAADPRFVQVLVPGRSEDPYGNHRYWPIWQAAAEHGLRVAITFGGGALTAPTAVGWTSTYFDTYVLAAQHFQTHATSLIASGVFDAYPNLQIVLLESGWTWLPAAMWRMDMCWKAGRREIPWVKDLPSRYIRKHFRLTTQPTDAPEQAAHLAQVVEELGSENMLMYSSDFPHQYPGDESELLKLVGPAHAERILWGNASECYDLERRREPTPVG